MQLILDKAIEEIDMIFLAFCNPDRIYYSDSCPASLGGYINKGFVWRFQIPEDLLFWATNHLLKYLTAIIAPWINLLANQLNKGDCALLMTDSTPAEGWMRKTNFNKAGVYPLKASVWVDVLNNMPDYLWMQMPRDTANGSLGR